MAMFFYFCAFVLLGLGLWFGLRRDSSEMLLLVGLVCGVALYATAWLLEAAEDERKKQLAEAEDLAPGGNDNHAPGRNDASE